MLPTKDQRYKRLVASNFIRLLGKIGLVEPWGLSRRQKAVIIKKFLARMSSGQQTVSLRSISNLGSATLLHFRGSEKK